MSTYSDLESNAKAWAARQPQVTLKNPLIDNAGITNTQAISKALTDYSNNVLGWSTNNNSANVSTNKVGTKNSNWFGNYFNKWGSDKYSLWNTGISAGADLFGNLINSNGFSTTAGNIMSGIGNIAGNIPGPIGWAGKGLALLGQGINALWGHKFNDANVAAAEKAVADRNNWQFGDYSNTASLLAGSLANKQLGNVSKDYLGKEGPFSHAVTDKMNEINNATLNANARANNSELLAYANYQNNLVRNAISNDGMGNVNMTANGGPLNMISGPMTPFGNRFFANGGFTHGGLFTNGFIEVNNGGSHEQNPNQGVQYGVDPQGTPNMVEEGETILDDYVFSRRIKFPKRYKDEFTLGGKIWKKSFADVSKMIAKESEERPNDPISQRSLKAMGGKLADIQEEVKAKQALDKMDPREVMAMLQQLAMLQQGGEQPQMMEDPYQQQMMQEQGMEEQPIMAANGGSIYIKPSKRGTFTAAATKHGMGVQEFASQVLANPDNYSSAMVKKANFARNAAKWHACGGKINKFDNGGNTIPNWMRYIPTINLFKVGGNSKSKYKSDRDWEQMYELSRPIYQQFINAGVDPIVAAGVLGNIALESSFNPNASNRTHWGYVQNDKHIKDYIVSNYGGYGPKQQLQFLIDGLTGNIKGSNKGKGKAIQKRFTNFLNASKGLTNPADVAALWDKHYEISGGQGMYDRRNYASRFWNRYNPQSTAQVQQLPDYSQATLLSDIVPQELADYGNSFTPSLEFNPQGLFADQNLLASRNGGGKKKITSNKTQTTPATATTTPLDVTQYGFKRNIKGLSDLESIYNNTKFDDNKSVANLLYHYIDSDIMDYKDAARLFYNIIHNTFPGMKEGEERTAYLKNLLGLRGEGYDDPVYKKDNKGKIVLGDDGKPVVDKAKSKHYDWVGPQYFKAVASTPSNFALSRGFKGNKDLRDLNYNFNDNSTVDDILDYLSSYGSTDPQVQGKLLNEFRANEEKLARQNYERLRELNSIIPSARLRELLSSASEEDIDEAIDMGLINENASYDDDFVNYANVDFDKAVAVDPTSDAFEQLTPAEQNVAEQLYLQDKFTNDKAYAAYKEKFDKEYANDLARRQREDEWRLNNWNNLPTWMRYAPLAFSSIATLTDALGLTNKPDLTPYQQLLAQSSQQGKTPAVRYNPVFQPLEYRPINLNADLLQAQNAFASANRNINNIAGANIGAGIAGNTSALNSALANIGKIRQGVSEQDIANRRMVADYNNRGAYQDTMGGLEAQKINAINQQNAQRFGYQALSDALRYYQSEQQAANAAKQVNLTHAVNSWANVGRENMYMNMINNNMAYDYGIGPNGNQWYKWLNPVT